MCPSLLRPQDEWAQTETGRQRRRRMDGVCLVNLFGR